MQMDSSNDEFDVSTFELFEVLGHPRRIKVIQVLGQEQTGFAGLMKEVGMQSKGYLAFHLAKLRGMVTLSQDGLYGLTAQGYDALRMVEAMKQPEAGERHYGTDEAARKGNATRK